MSGLEDRGKDTHKLVQRPHVVGRDVSACEGLLCERDDGRIPSCSSARERECTKGSDVRGLVFVELEAEPVDERAEDGLGEVGDGVSGLLRLLKPD